MIIAALDVSLLNTAVFVGDAHSFEHKTFSAANRGDDVNNRLWRYSDIVYPIVDFLTPREPVFIFIEAYSFLSKGNSLTKLSELGGILRWELIEITRSVIEVPPARLKKFICARGNARKTEIVARITREFGLSFRSDDEYDAFGLHRFGLCATNQIQGKNQAQLEATAEVAKECGEYLKEIDEYDNGNSTSQKEEEGCEAKEGQEASQAEAS